MSFFENHLGEFAALLTACFWTITALSFESATNKIGSVAVNILRFIIGFIFLSIFTLVHRGMIFPVDAGSGNWFWLTLSGLVGFVFGDLFLFKSYTLIGSRFAMLIMTLVPPITAFLGFIILGERLTIFNFLGMTLAFFGITLAIFSRNGKGDRFSLKLSPRGILYAFGGAVGQIKYTATGISSTIMALVPVLIILPAVVLYKQKVTFAEAAGAIISVAGVALFFIYPAQKISEQYPATST